MLAPDAAIRTRCGPVSAPCHGDLARTVTDARRHDSLTRGSAAWASRRTETGSAADFLPPRLSAAAERAFVNDLKKVAKYLASL